MKKEIEPVTDDDDDDKEPVRTSPNPTVDEVRQQLDEAEEILKAK